MSERPLFLDVNVPMYAAGGDHPLREACARIMSAVAKGELAAAIDVEIIQEILHRFGAMDRWPLAVELAQTTLTIMPIVLPITKEDMITAVELAERYGSQGAKARDLIHAAVMRNNGLSAIVSTDRHFDLISGLTRIDPIQLFEDQVDT